MARILKEFFPTSIHCSNVSHQASAICNVLNINLLTAISTVSTSHMEKRHHFQHFLFQTNIVNALTFSESAMPPLEKNLGMAVDRPNNYTED